MSAPKRRRGTLTVGVDAPWMVDASCNGEPLSVFFEPDNQGRGSHWAAARLICAGCPVKNDCLTYAEKHHITHGVWGGLTPRERTKRRRQLNAREP